MKNIKIITLLTFILSIFIFTSCQEGDDKWINSDINIDPNNPSDVTVNLLLPTTQGGLAYLMGGDIGRYNSLLTQHVGGLSRQHAGIDQYRLTEADVNNAWRFNLYSGPLFDLNTIIIKAGEEGSPHFVGAAKVLMALGLGITTDLWGDIPYSQAFQGAANLTPAYDTQEQIYGTINTLLTEAVSDLGSTSNVRALSGDLIYGGSKSAWQKAANALKARYAIHLSKVNGASAYTAALAAIDAGAFASNADDMEFSFGSPATEQNPWYQFLNQRQGDIAMGAFFVDLMKSINDPRLPVFAADKVDRAGTPDDDSDDDYFGSPAGVPNEKSSQLGAYYGSPSSPVPMMSYVEQKFIEAEAAFMTGNLQRAATAHNDAIIASINKFGVFDQAYVDAQASETSASLNLQKIMTHKYIALYTQSETWTDWRRTGIPALQPSSGQNIPIRWPYPQDQRLYNNENLPSGITIFSPPLWWDK
ncbi:MAG: SusD/RagB family nutrient-binding outer membrane lipoprotein [Chitinophagales bacterium]